MCAHRISQTPRVLLSLLTVLIASPVSAQTSSSQKLDDALTQGRTVWITDSTGREDKTRIVGLSGDTVTVTDERGGGRRQILKSGVVRVRARQSDSVLNGALIGAGVAIGSGLFLCRLTESWENCRDDVGPITRIGALGAGIGIAVDALIRGRKTIYEANPRLRAAPVIARGGGGVKFSLRF